ncbi:MAG: DUF3466 family protein [Planctomycetota bacterium]
MRCSSGIRWGWGGVACLASLFVGSRAQAQCQYDVTIIQGPWCEPYGFPPTVGTGENEAGDVVGYYFQCDIGPHRAFMWTEESGTVALPLAPSFSASEAWDINGQGGIVGHMKLADIDLWHAALWQGGDVFDLGTLPGGNYSEAFAINDRGQVVGESGNSVTGPIRAFVWQDGVMQDLKLPLGPNSAAADINEKGQVVGWMGQSFGIDSHAFIWQDGEVTDLGVIPGGFTARGRAVNSEGHVAGSGRIPAKGVRLGIQRAFFWDGEQMVNLGTLPPYARSAAVGINDNDEVVGWVCCPDGNPNITDGFIWKNGVMTALNDLIPPELGVNLNIAYAINEQGEIAGYAGALGTLVAVLLTPVEPPLGDLNGDCRIGIPDLLLLLANWGSCWPKAECPADLNGDGTVGVPDLLILLMNWG